MSRMKSWGQVLLITLGALVALQGLQFAVQGGDYWLYRTFAPRREAVRREVFEQTRSFNEGMAQELWDMEVQYNRADAIGKASLRSIILHRVAGYDIERLNPELRGFILGLRAEELGGSK